MILSINKNQGITDTHAHLCDKAFDSDLTPVIERAASAGVSSIICVGEDILEIKGIMQDEVIDRIGQNTGRLYGEMRGEMYEESRTGQDRA